MLDLIATDYKDILFNTARIFSSVFEIVLAYIMAGSFYTHRFSRRRFDALPFAAVAAGAIFLQENGVPPAARYAAECAALAVILFLLFTDKPAKKTVGVMIFAVMLAVSQIGARLLFTALVKRIPETQTLSAPFLQLLRINLANGILIPAAVFFSALSKHFRKTSASLPIWTVLLSVPVVTLLTFSVFQYSIETDGVDGRIYPYILLSCLGLVFVNALVFVLFARLQKQLELQRDTDVLQSQLRLQEESVKRLETLYNRTRTFRHDIKNHILLLNVLAEQENYDDLRQYLREMSGAVDESDYVRISGISAVDAILNEKMYEAQAADITTSFDVVNLEKSGVAPIDLCIILSNALDNAIEANRLIEDKTRRLIRVKVHGNGTFCVISVSNPVAETPRKDHEGRFRTTKADAEAHGFGLKSIENTAEKYNGEMLAKSEDGTFTLVVRLNSKKTGSQPRLSD